jgi:hypothetical protein
VQNDGPGKLLEFESKNNRRAIGGVLGESCDDGGDTDCRLAKRPTYM